MSYIKNKIKTFNFFNNKNQTSPWFDIFKNSEDFLSKFQRPNINKKIICATNVGGHGAVTPIDSIVATSLWLRGADVKMLLCDKALSACEAAMFHMFPNKKTFLKNGTSHLCGNCFKSGVDYYSPLHIETLKLSSFHNLEDLVYAKSLVKDFSINDCFKYQDDGVDIGEQVRAGVLRFFGKATFEDEDPIYVREVSKQYVIAGIITSICIRNLIIQHNPNTIVSHHGVYIPQGVVGEVARRNSVDVTNWGPSYRNTTVIYSHGDTYHHTFMDESTNYWDEVPLNTLQENQLMDYLNKRRVGMGDWSWVTPDRGGILVEEHKKMIDELKLDDNKPIFGLLTNVLWDAQLFYNGIAFSNMLDWLFFTIDHFIMDQSKQLVIRIHPHEVKTGNRQPTIKEIDKRYKVLPNNIKIILHDSPYSTYALMDLCKVVLIYGTKTGVELAPYGKPIIVAGDAWIRNKGISIDITSVDQYLDILNKINEIPPLTKIKIDRAKQYAYHYFFKRMIPLKSLDPNASFPPKIAISNLEALLPGNDKGLDVICDGILNKTPFIYNP
jgi:hypothetical protein